MMGDHEAVAYGGAAQPGAEVAARPMAHTRRLSTQILISQLVVLVVVSAGGLALYAQEARGSLDRQAEQRALAVSLATAAMPQVAEQLAAGDQTGVLAQLAERVRNNTASSYVVIIDLGGRRHSHPDPLLIGQPVSEPLVVLDGGTHTGVDDGHLGRSANGKAPVRTSTGAIVGEVSAGLLERQVARSKSAELRRLIGYAALALAAGALVSLWLARRLKRQTFNLELDEIAALLQEREAMLHGIREGVVTLDPSGRVSLLNDEAQRLLEVASDTVGKQLDDALPPGRLRSLLSGLTDSGDDEVVLTDQFCLAVNRMPVRVQGRDLGAVVTLRDRTEHLELLRELDSVALLTDALRAQQHEHANRMHTIGGLLELDRPDEAVHYLHQVAGDSAGLAEELKDRLGDVTIAALLLGKVTVARERGVALTIGIDSLVDHTHVDPRLAVTVLGNLLDNAVDAAAGSREAAVHLELDEHSDGLLVRVTDSGEGLSDGARQQVFHDGYSTKAPREGVHRGLGLALVHRLVTQAGGTVEVLAGRPTVFQARLPATGGAPR